MAQRKKRVSSTAKTAKHLNGGSLLSRIKAQATGVPYEVVEMPEWSGSIVVKGTNVEVGLALASEELRGVRGIANQVKNCTYHEDGKQLVFEDVSIDELAGIMLNSTSPQWNRIVGTLHRLNGVDAAETKRMQESFTQAVEEGQSSP